MGLKYLIFLVIVLLLISGCATNKTQPAVTDITGAVTGDVQEGENVSKGGVENETVPDEVEKEENEETKEEESEETEVEEELPPGTHLVTIKKLKLEPQELTIKKGNTVIWEHQDEWEEDDETRHYLAAHSNEFRTPILYKGDKFEHTFNETGTFTYIDVLYKGRGQMRGKIIVE